MCVCVYVCLCVWFSFFIQLFICILVFSLDLFFRLRGRGIVVYWVNQRKARKSATPRVQLGSQALYDRCLLWWYKARADPGIEIGRGRNCLKYKVWRPPWGAQSVQGESPDASGHYVYRAWHMSPTKSFFTISFIVNEVILIKSHEF